jgi:Secretion system C-terminal sorting domain
MSLYTLKGQLGQRLSIIHTLILGCICLFSASLPAQSIINGGFVSGTANWGCTPELNPETVYGGGNGGNTVAEIDNLVSLCQTVSGFTVGTAYNLTYLASRRLGGCPGPNPATIGVSIAALSTSDSRTNTVWALSPTTFTFTATATTHTLNIVHQFVAYTTCGFIIDDIAITISPPFAVKLAAFDLAALTDGSVAVQWATAAEWNQASYVLEKSVDGVNWQHIQTVPSQGDAATPQQYQVEDHAAHGSSFYRQSATDRNGQTQMLALRQYSPPPALAPAAFPNPTDGAISIRYPHIQNADFALVDLLGRLHAITPLVAEDGNATFSLADIPNGMYVLRIRLDGKVHTQKLWITGGL